MAVAGEALRRLASALDGRYADVHYRESVPGRDILAIWQPGDPDYDRHIELPR